MTYYTKNTLAGSYKSSRTNSTIFSTSKKKAQVEQPEETTIVKDTLKNQEDKIISMKELFTFLK